MILFVSNNCLQFRYPAVFFIDDVRISAEVISQDQLFFRQVQDGCYLGQMVTYQMGPALFYLVVCGLGDRQPVCQISLRELLLLAPCQNPFSDLLIVHANKNIVKRRIIKYTYGYQKQHKINIKKRKNLKNVKICPVFF